MTYLYYLDINPLSHIIFKHLFSMLLFSFVDTFLCCAKACNFLKFLIGG